MKSPEYVPVYTVILNSVSRESFLRHLPINIKGLMLLIATLFLGSCLYALKKLEIPMNLWKIYPGQSKLFLYLILCLLQTLSLLFQDLCIQYITLLYMYTHTFMYMHIYLYILNCYDTECHILYHYHGFSHWK